MDRGELVPDDVVIGVVELRDRTGTLPARVFREADRIGLPPVPASGAD